MLKLALVAGSAEEGGHFLKELATEGVQAHAFAGYDVAPCGRKDFLVAQEAGRPEGVEITRLDGPAYVRFPGGPLAEMQVGTF